MAYYTVVNAVDRSIWNSSNYKKHEMTHTYPWPDKAKQNESLYDQTFTPLPNTNRQNMTRCRRHIMNN